MSQDQENVREEGWNLDVQNILVTLDFPGFFDKVDFWHFLIMSISDIKIQ